MLTPSSKLSTTWQKPNLDTERSSLTPGKPLSTCSIGNVICCSISSGLRAGAIVLICTCTGVVSGNASTSRWRSDTTPTATAASASSTTSNRCRNETSMSQLSMTLPSGVLMLAAGCLVLWCLAAWCLVAGTNHEHQATKHQPTKHQTSGPTGPLVPAPSAGAEVVFQELRTNVGAILGGDDFALHQADDDLRVRRRLHAGADGANVEHLGRARREEILVSNKDDVAVAVPVDRLVGHQDRLLLFTQNDLALAERVGEQRPVRIGD